MDYLPVSTRNKPVIAQEWVPIYTLLILLELTCFLFKKTSTGKTLIINEQMRKLNYSENKKKSQSLKLIKLCHHHS